MQMKYDHACPLTIQTTQTVGFSRSSHLDGMIPLLRTLGSVSDVSKTSEKSVTIMH